MTAYGYARVSTTGQRLDRQIDVLKPLVDRLHHDKISGKDMDRPAWKRLMKRLRPGDVLYVASLDRMGRNYQDVCDAWQALTAQGVDIVVLDMPLLDTRESPGGRHRTPHLRHRDQAFGLCGSNRARKDP